MDVVWTELVQLKRSCKAVIVEEMSCAYLKLYKWKYNQECKWSQSVNEWVVQREEMSLGPNPYRDMGKEREGDVSKP